jgi:hypothetical protein
MKVRHWHAVSAAGLLYACAGQNEPAASASEASASPPQMPTVMSTSGTPAAAAMSPAPRAGSNAQPPAASAAPAAAGASSVRPMMTATSIAAGAGGGGTPATTMPMTAVAGMQAPPAACDPADKGPEPKAASFKQIMGYQNLSEPPTTGPHKAVLEEDPSFPDWTIYRPETLGETLHPVLAWGEGGCLKNGTLYGNWLLELASHGYIALADGPPTEAGSDPVGAGMRQGADGKALISAIDWLIAENDRPCSRFYHKVATTKLAVAGQSCGGLMALYSAGDKRITTAIIGNSGLFAADQATYSALHSPIAYLIGGPNDVAYQNAERDFMNINNVPIFYANMSVGHGGTWNAHNGGEFGRVGTAWLNWQLKDDMAASKLFVGPDCELCKSPSMWTVEKKMLD